MHREFRRLFWPCRRPCSVAQRTVDNEQAEVVIDGVATTNNLHDALVAGSVEGAVVTLLKDVDLAGKNWEPIAVFHGTFDGAGYKISNLSIEQEANYAGFIAELNGPNDGKLSSAAVVENVTFENVTVSAPNQQYVAVVAAHSSYNIMISNVTVTGSIKVEGKKYVGTILGNGYINRIVDCKVDGRDNTESYVKGSVTGSAQFGGIVGMLCEGDFPIFNCSVKNIKIAGDSIVGGIAGRSKEGNDIVGCSVENVILVTDAATQGAMVGQRLTEGTSVSMLLNYSQTDTVLEGTDGSTKEFAWYGAASGAIRYIYSQNAVGNALVAGASNYALTAGDYTLEGEGALAALTAQCAAGYAPVDNEDGTYTIKQVWDVTFYVGDVVSNAQVVVNGECAKEFAYDTEAIEAWTNATGVAFAFTTPITEATTLFAQLKQSALPIPTEDFPEDIDPADAEVLEATAANLIKSGVDAAALKAATAAAKAGETLTPAQQNIINSLLLQSNTLVEGAEVKAASIAIVNGKVTVTVEGVNCTLPAKTTIGYLTVKHCETVGGDYKAVKRITVTSDGVGTTAALDGSDAAGFYKAEFEWNKPVFEAQ